MYQCISGFSVAQSETKKGTQTFGILVLFVFVRLLGSVRGSVSLSSWAAPQEHVVPLSLRWAAVRARWLWTLGRDVPSSPDLTT